MNRSPIVDPLEEQLSHPPRLDGQAFTADVLRRLPPQRDRLRARILCAGAALATGVAAVLLAGRASGLGPALLAAAQGSLPEGAGVSALLALIGLGLTAAVAGAGELAGDRRADAA
jgi:hypothetical protein